MAVLCQSLQSLISEFINLNLHRLRLSHATATPRYDSAELARPNQLIAQPGLVSNNCELNSLSSATRTRSGGELVGCFSSRS